MYTLSSQKIANACLCGQILMLLSDLLVLLLLLIGTLLAGKGVKPPAVRCKEFWASNGNRCRLNRVRGTWVATDEDWESFGNGTRPARKEPLWVSGSFKQTPTIKKSFCVPPKPSSCSIVKSGRYVCYFLIVKSASEICKGCSESRFASRVLTCG